MPAAGLKSLPCQGQESQLKCSDTSSPSINTGTIFKQNEKKKTLARSYGREFQRLAWRSLVMRTDKLVQLFAEQATQ